MGVFEQFPYSNFHDMNLDWILGLLKKWEDIADNIGEMVDEAVEKGLSELNIEEMITNILINYEFAINVKNPPEGLTPAKGDGTTDDTAAINGCVNYAAGLTNGGIVFFPQGLYLTDTVTLPSNVTLMGLSKHNVKLVKKASANSTFIGGNGSNNAIYGLTLDGNQVSSAVQVNGFIGMPVDMEIRECSINNCGGRGVSWSGTNLTIDSVEFEGSGINCLLINGNGNVSVKNVLFKSLSEVAGDGVIVVNSDNCDIDFRSIANCNQCLVLEGENNYVHCRITGATIPVTDNGSGNSVINVVGDTTVNGQDIVINGSQHVDINGKDVVLNPTNPLTYKTPSKGFTFDTIRMKDGVGNIYNVLVENVNTKQTPFNVKDYGAVGNGITDDSDAIQECINQAQAVNGIIIFPVGTYKITKTLTINDGVTIIGYSNGIGATSTSQIQRTKASNIEASTEFTSGDMISINTTRQVLICNILFSYEDLWVSFVNRTGGCAVNIKGNVPSTLYLTNSQTTIENCAFTGMYNCIEYGQTVWCKLFNNMFYLWNNYAVIFDNKLTSEEVLSGWIVNNFFYGNVSENVTQQGCIRLNSGYAFIDKNYIGGSIHAIDIYNVGVEAGSVIISNNDIEQQFVGAIHAKGGKITGLHIKGNYFSNQQPSAGTYVIYVENDCDIVDCIISDNISECTLRGSSHFSIQGGDVIIKNNVLNNKNTAGSIPFTVLTARKSIVCDNTINNFVNEGVTFNENVVYRTFDTQYTVENMPTNAANGSLLYVSDGNKTSADNPILSSGGSGTLCVKYNNNWYALY